MDHCPLISHYMVATLKCHVTLVIHCQLIEFLCVLQDLGLVMLEHAL